MPKREPAVCVPATDNPDVRPSNSNDDRIAALEAKVAELTIAALEARIAALQAQARTAGVTKHASTPLPASPTGGPVTGNFRPVAVSRETEVVSDPTTAAIRSRQARRNDMAPPVLRFGGQADNGPVLKASPTYDVRSNRPVFTKPASLSGRTAID
jgi:hypothetical protein